MRRRTLFYSACIVTLGIALLLGVSASASTIDWTTWSSNNSGTNSGLGITVSYSGEADGLSMNYPSWTPVGTFSGGTIGNPPLSSFNMVRELGGNSTVDTVTFSAPVANPVMAIWSLGQAGDTADFTFTASEPFTIESGGPSAEFGGTSIFVCSGNPMAVCGTEGNGTVQFHGTFSSISWREPVFENYYGWTVGGPSVVSVVPEPNTLLLLGSSGLGLAVYIRKRFRRG